MGRLKFLEISLVTFVMATSAKTANRDNIWSSFNGPSMSPLTSEYVIKDRKQTKNHSSIEVFDRSGMEFCDGPTSFTASRTECKYGYLFGTRIPQCLCFRGLYRMILDDCFESDGLAESQICTKPFDTQRESGAKIYTVQITQEINWDHTHVVCEKEERAGVKIWSATALHGNVKTVSVTLPAEEPDFYVINGVAYMVDVAANRQAICVEQNYVSSFKQDKICRYFRNDNDAWRTEKAVEITIRYDKCPPNSKQMIPSECFPSQREGSSECELPCGKRDVSKPLVPNTAGTAASDAVGLTSRAKLTDPSNANLMAPLPFDDNSLSSDAPSDIRFDNLFLDRKMLQYLVVSNLRDIPPLPPLQPNRTFELFDRLATITKSFCPEVYVHPTFIDSVLELFKLIHVGGSRGNLTYPETINEADFNWTRDILDKCIGTAVAKPITLTPQPIDEGPDPQDPPEGDDPKKPKPNVTEPCGDDNGKLWGYCPEGKCDILHAKEVKPHKSKTEGILKEKHYVPELAWNILDITQAICFVDFNSSYRMFHIVQQAVEHLFTDQIRNLWNYPPYNDPASKVKAQLLGVDADEQMYNLEICTASVYDLVKTGHLRKYGDKATTLVRLKRPDTEITSLKRKKRAAKTKSISAGVDAYCLMKSKDWKYPESCFGRD